ncbi:hypothetical protein ROHU_035396 [Labeo rohita]|uniref:Uncharacterized protein n=1 Tax=Labeo rohita TaxID=84645 RepID=A0A498LMX0_LABRO|nr:hypothetical protein ROHU_035396 [Labeo rohita]
MASNEPSYWTLRRKAKDKVDKQLRTIQAPTYENELGYMQSNTRQDQIDEETYMDWVSHIDETEAVNIENVSEDSESDTESESETDPISLEEDLATWATEHKVTHVALNSLLHILRLHNLNLPKDSRTLLGTMRLNPEIQDKAGGQYFHFGVLNSIEEVLHQNVDLLRNIDTLDLQNTAFLFQGPQGTTKEEPTAYTNKKNKIKKMFLIVEFEGEGTTGPVAKTWYADGYSWWPPYKDLDKLLKSVRTMETPQPEKGWTRHRARILHESVSFQNVANNWKKASYTSDINSEPEIDGKRIPK